MSDPAADRAISLLVAAAFADESLSDAEAEMLYRKAATIGVLKTRLDEMIRQARQGLLRISLPSSTGERERLLDSLMDILCADGRIERVERQFLQRYASLLGGAPPDLSERLRQRLNRAAERPAPQPARRIEFLERPLDSSSPSTDVAARVPPVPGEARPARESEAPAPPTVANAPALKGSDAPPSGPAADVLHRPPGPVRLSLPELGAVVGDLPPVTLALVRQVIQMDGAEEAVAYVERSCLKSRDEARRIVENILAAYPDVKPGKRKVTPR